MVEVGCLRKEDTIELVGQLFEIEFIKRRAGVVNVLKATTIIGISVVPTKQGEP